MYTRNKLSKSKIQMQFSTQHGINNVKSHNEIEVDNNKHKYGSNHDLHVDISKAKLRYASVIRIRNKRKTVNQSKKL